MTDVIDSAVTGWLSRFERYDVVSSTNDVVTGWLRDGVPEVCVAITDVQTAGRGRLGRSWQAPGGTSLLFSLALMPPVPPGRLPELTLVTARAVADGLACTAGVQPAIKYPNDLLVRGRKVAGILGEAREGHVVVGVGVNVNIPGGRLPRDAATPPTSLLLETGKPQDRGLLLAAILVALERRYDAWLAQA